LPAQKATPDNLVCINNNAPGIKDKTYTVSYVYMERSDDLSLGITALSQWEDKILPQLFTGNTLVTGCLVCEVIAGGLCGKAGIEKDDWLVLLKDPSCRDSVPELRCSTTEKVIKEMLRDGAQLISFCVIRKNQNNSDIFTNAATSSLQAPSEQKGSTQHLDKEFRCSGNESEQKTKVRPLCGFTAVDLEKYNSLAMACEEMEVKRGSLPADVTQEICRVSPAIGLALSYFIQGERMMEHARKMKIDPTLTLNNCADFNNTKPSHEELNEIYQKHVYTCDKQNEPGGIVTLDNTRWKEEVKTNLVSIYKEVINGDPDKNGWMPKDSEGTETEDTVVEAKKESKQAS
jgi:hypothetical protein